MVSDDALGGAAQANAIASANATIPLAIRLAVNLLPSNDVSDRARVPFGAIPARRLHRVRAGCSITEQAISTTRHCRSSQQISRRGAKGTLQSGVFVLKVDVSQRKWVLQTDMRARLTATIRRCK